MSARSGNKIKTVLFYISLSFIAGVIGFHYYQKVFAEKSGSSPESGSNSRLTSMAATISALNYGSTAAGTWGDYGTSLNQLFSAAQETFNDAKANGTKNGSGTGATNYLSSYTQALGGVDDYNNNQTIPSDSYHKTWTACNSGNSYCGTSDATNADHQDPNTGLVWSIRINGGSTANWFTANNCAQPSNGVAPLGANACSNNGDVGCVCTKLTGGSKTGCEALGSTWRLPYQKELMQSYIDGSYSNLTNAAYFYWSSTTRSNGTQYAWYTYQYNGVTSYDTKVTSGSYYVRCVR